MCPTQAEVVEAVEEALGSKGWWGHNMEGAWTLESPRGSELPVEQ